MQAPNLDWRPVSEKPEHEGLFLVWSYRQGVRFTRTHPSWWNNANYPEVSTVTLFVYLGSHLMTQNLRDMQRARKRT